VIGEQTIPEDIWESDFFDTRMVQNQLQPLPDCARASVLGRMVPSFFSSHWSTNLSIGVDIAEDGAAVFFVADSNSFQRPSSSLRTMPRRTVCSLPLCFYLRGFIFD